MAESVFVQGASSETAAASLVQVVEAEEKGKLVDVEKVMALDGEKEMSRLRRERSTTKSRRSNSGGRLRGEKGWLNGLALKLNYEPCLSSFVEASAAEPIDVWARAAIGTTWLCAIEDAVRHEHPQAGNLCRLSDPTKQQTGHV